MRGSYHLGHEGQWRGAIGRARLPVPSGVSPASEDSVQPSTSIRATSEDRYVDIEQLKQLSSEQVMASLNGHMPYGIEVVRRAKWWLEELGGRWRYASYEMRITVGVLDGKAISKEEELGV